MRYIILVFFIGILNVNAQVGINTTTPDPSSMLDITSTDKGMLIPRMTEAQRTAITTPATGLLVYQTDNTDGFWYFDGVNWLSLSGGADSDWNIVGSDLESAVSGSVTASEMQISNTGRGTSYGGLYNKDIASQTTDYALLQSDGGETFLNAGGGNDLHFRANNTEYMTMLNNGNVGIGTLAPVVELHVNGQFKLVDGSEGAGKVLTSNGTGLASWKDASTLDDGDWIISSNNMFSNVSGNIGIGTNNPSSKLSIITSEDRALESYTNLSVPITDVDASSYPLPLSSNSWSSSAPQSQSFLISTSGIIAYRVTYRVPSGTALVNVSLHDGSNSSAPVIETINNVSFTSFGVQSIPFSSAITAGTTYTVSFSVVSGVFEIWNTTNSNHYPDGEAGIGGDGRFSVIINPTGSFLLHRSSGLGINTMNPAASLDVNGRIKYTDGNESSGKVLTCDATGFATWQNVSTGEMEISNTGRGASFGGIYNKDVPSQTTDYALLQSDAGETFLNSGGGNTLHFRTDNTERMTLTNGGNLGIGTTNPTQAKLVVGGSSTNTLNYGYLNSSGATGTSSGTNAYSIHASSRISAQEFNAFSDERIKKINGVSNSTQDLETLSKIEITDYTLIDSIAKGNKAFKKVIAQQVEEVYPQAVTNDVTEVIPNIYKLSEIHDGWIALATDLKVGDKVKLIFSNKEELLTVEEISKKGFKVAKEKQGKVFVYGKQVEDFHTVDYEAISMLNVSATQELLKRIEQLEKQNKTLNNNLSDLENRFSKLESLLLKNSREVISAEK